MLDFLKGLYHKIKSTIRSCLKFVSNHITMSFFVCLLGLISTHTLMHLLVLTGASLFIINMLHLMFVLGFIIIVLSKIGQMSIFDGEVKILRTSPTNVVSPN
jgi:hypothetical protein